MRRYFPFLVAGLAVLAVLSVFFGLLVGKGGMWQWSGTNGRLGRFGIAEQLHMTREELREELSRGKSMMDIARERGVALTLPPRFFRPDRRQAFLQHMAGRLGMSMDDLQERLSSGKSILDVAEERGVVLSFPFPRMRGRAS